MKTTSTKIPGKRLMTDAQRARMIQRIIEDRLAMIERDGWEEWATDALTSGVTPLALLADSSIIEMGAPLLLDDASAED